MAVLAFNFLICITSFSSFVNPKKCEDIYPLVQVFRLSGNKRNKIKIGKDEKSTVQREMDHDGSHAGIDFMFRRVSGATGK